MARNLLAQNRRVVAFDVVPAALDRIRAEGAEVATSPAAMAEQCDAVVTMLPSNAHVREAYLGAEGVLQTLPRGALCVDSSTIDPSVSREVAARALAAGCDFADAPVSGGVGGAEQGTLTFMVGGPEATFERCGPLLALMGKNVVHCGDVGTGQVAKLCNNMVLAVSMVGVSEAMNLGSKLGMDRSKLAGILNTSTARCWSSDTYNPAPGVMEGVPSSRGYEGGFGTALMLKDLGLVQDAARAAGAPIPMGASAQAFYQTMVAHGLGGKDFSVAFKFLGGEDKDPDPKP